MDIPVLAGIQELFVAIVAAGVFIYFGSKAGETGDAKAIKKKAYGIRKIWFVFLLVIAILATAMVIPGQLPYPDSPEHAVAPGVVKAADTPDAVTVNVEAFQWGWNIDTMTVPTNTPVKFKVTSRDINHGMGLYRDGNLVAQVQAMPDYTNELVLKFEEPGTYNVLCLEYCGTGHATMRSAITVED